MMLVGSVRENGAPVVSSDTTWSSVTTAPPEWVKVCGREFRHQCWRWEHRRVWLGLAGVNELAEATNLFQALAAASHVSCNASTLLRT